MDIHTILVLLMIGYLFIIILIKAYSSSYKSYELTLANYSNVLFFISYTILLARSYNPTIFLLILSNSSLIVAITLQAIVVLYSLQKWNRKIRILYIIIPLLATFLFYSYVITTNRDGPRITIISAIVLTIISYPTYILLTDKNSTIYKRILGVLYLFTCISFALRSGAALMPGSQINFLSTGFGNYMAFLSLFVIMIIGSPGLLLLIKAKDDLELLNAATIDSLTGIYNRPTIIKECEKQIKLHYRQKRPVSLLTLDIDHFKSINDTYGHQFGDTVLKSLAHTISRSLRSYDYFGRLGGEEFIILLPEIDKTAAIAIAERIRKSIETQIIDNVSITISIGGATLLPDKNTDFNKLFKLSDSALYKAKETGRNKVTFFSEK